MSRTTSSRKLVLCEMVGRVFLFFREIVQSKALSLYTINLILSFALHMVP